jgi:glycosyltransferase involved in cell wall biosynthesis
MKVSIITPAYNQAQFIEETINSVLNQDYPDIEYIVLDDGSNDGTDQVLMSYIDRLKYVRHENIGESKTVNKGYHLCSGDVIGIVNSDDPLFTDDAVSRIVECFQKNSNALAVYPDWVSIDEEGNIINRIILPQYTIKNMLEEFNVALGPGMFIKSSALMKVGYRNESLKYTGDLDLSFRLALEGSLAHIPAFLATHRVHSRAASSTSQGSLMAKEVLRLATSSLKSSMLPLSIIQKNRLILANAHFIASAYCGSNKLLQFKYIGKSIFFDPSFISITYFKRSQNLVKIKNDTIATYIFLKFKDIRSAIPLEIKRMLKVFLGLR